jgi:hypothetical protein
MTPEGRIETYLRQRVKASGGHIRKLRWIGRNGAPDDFIWWPGPRMAFVECKAPGGRLRKLQQVEIDRLRADGFLVFVVDSYESVDAAISGVLQSDG